MSDQQHGSNDDLRGWEPHAVVVDTNAHGGGRFHPRQLASDAALCADNGVELWVPEVVLWEWVAHARADAQKKLDESSAALTGLRDVGTPVLWPIPSIAEVEESLTRIVRGTDGVHLIACSPDSARAALRDQIMQTGPASIKKEIKTGAADSAWLRDVAEENGGVLDDGLLLITGDRAAVSGICVQEGWTEPRVVAHIREIAPTLGWARRLTETEEQSWLLKIQTAMPWFSDLPDWYKGPAVDLSDLDIEEQPAVYEYDWTGQQVVSPTLGNIFRIISIDDGQIALDETSAYVEFTCEATIDAQRVVIDQADGSVQFEFTDAQLPLRLNAEINLVQGEIASVYLS